METFKVGQWVARKLKPYNSGIIEEFNRAVTDPPGSYLNGFYKRARVCWNHSGVRTWVRLDTLQEYQGAQIIITPANGRTGIKRAFKSAENASKQR